MPTQPTIRDSAIALLHDMSFWGWFATGEVLFLGRFAEAYHLPNAPTPNVSYPVNVSYLIDNTSSWGR